MIDVVVMDFTQDDFCEPSRTAIGRWPKLIVPIVIAVKMLDPLYDLRPRDMKRYAEGTKINAMWGMYARHAWQLAGTIAR